MRKRTAPLLAIVAVAALALLASGASGLLAANEGDQSLAGSWQMVVKPDSPPPGAPEEFVNLATFMPDGGFITSTGSASDSLGHGTWGRIDNRHFAVTCLGLSYDEAGAPAYMWKLRATLAYTEGRSELAGQWIIDIYDATEHQWGTVATGTTRGVRINVEKLL